MKLQLYHPELANRSCELCKQWMFDEKTGAILKRGEMPIPRPAGTKTPCWECPKDSPEQAKYTELSAKNHKTLALYHEAQGCFGLPEGWKEDSILRRNIGIIHKIYEEFRNYQLSMAALGGMVKR